MCLCVVIRLRNSLVAYSFASQTVCAPSLRGSSVFYPSQDVADAAAKSANKLREFAAMAARRKNTVTTGVGNRGRGRPAGSKNKITVAAKEAFAAAFREIGGVRALSKWARRNPDEFYKLYAKLIPVELRGGGEDGAIQIVISSGDAKL
jgi:hypothetical protein